MIFTKKAKFLIAFYLVVALYWAIVYLKIAKSHEVIIFYQFLFSLVPILGGVGGLINSKKWGLLTSKLGKSLFYLSAGLISWGLGQVVWAYYVIVLNQSTPYPSLADVGYVLAIPLWSVGLVYMAQATGARYGFKKTSNKILVVVLPLIAVLIAYFLPIGGGNNGAFAVGESPVKIFLDVFYPLSDVITLTLSFILFSLTFNFLGGAFRIPVLSLLIGFVVEYVVDFSFSYVTNNGSYYNGHWVDLVFPTAMVLIGFAVCSIEPLKRVKQRAESA